MRLSFRTGLAGANRRRPGISRLGHCLFRDGLRNCFFGMPFVRGLPPSRHIRCSSVVTGDPGRRQRRCAPTLLSRSACAGTAAVRTAKPARSRATVSRSRFLEMNEPSYTRQLNFKGAGWTPARPPAGGSREVVWCRPGRSFWKLFALGRGRHHSVALAVVCFDVPLRVLQVALKQLRLQFEAPPVEAQVDAIWELC